MFDLSSSEARLLLDIALMATGQNRFRSAATILAALEAFRSKEVSLAVARAIYLISLQEFEGAITYIDTEALAKFPESAMLRAFKGMALVRMGRTLEARQPLEEAMASGDPAAANLARDLLSASA